MVILGKLAKCTSRERRKRSRITLVSQLSTCYLLSPENAMVHLLLPMNSVTWITHQIRLLPYPG